MATIICRGKQTTTNAELPVVGAVAPDFRLTTSELSDVSLADYQGKCKLLYMMPSLDTPVCMTSTKKFNDFARQYDNVVMLMITADLPFAQKRFCTDENLENVIPLAMMRSKNFAKDYGVLIQDGVFEGISARAVVVLNEEDKVVYAELVPDTSQEPDYEAALAALSNCIK